jgi:hypothetical protein
VKTRTSIFQRITDRNDLVLGDRVVVVDIRGDDPLTVHTVDRPSLVQFPVESFGALDNPAGYDVANYPSKILYRLSETIDPPKLGAWRCYCFPVSVSCRSKPAMP